MEEIGAVSGAVYAISDDGQGRGHFNIVYALNTSTGKALWRKQLQESNLDTWLLDNGTLYLASQSSFYAVNTSDGTIKWHVKLKVFDAALAVIPLPPTLINGVLYCAMAGLGLYAVNANDGSTRWSVKLSSVSYIQVIVDGVLYVSSQGDTITHGPDYLLAFKSSDGSQVWRDQIGFADGLFYASDVAVG